MQRAHSRNKSDAEAVAAALRASGVHVVGRVEDFHGDLV
jgi:hypothetical protein